MPTKKDAAILGTSGGSLAAALLMVYQMFFGGMQGDIDRMDSKIRDLENTHALRCDVDAAIFKGRADDMRDAAALAQRVVNRTRLLQDILSQQDPPEDLPTSEANKLLDYQRQYVEFMDRARLFDESAITVCLSGT